MADKPRRVETLDELRRLVPVLVKRANDDQAFALRALSNPLLALEEAGVTLSPELSQHVERLARFSPKDVSRAEEISKKVFAISGKPFDIFSTEEVDKYRPVASKSKATKTAKGGRSEYDRLVAEYRKLAAPSKTLASREAYDRLKAGKTKPPLTKVTFVLQKAIRGRG